MATVVMDANLGIALVVNLSYSSLAEARIETWRSQNVEIVVPDLWWYEVASSLRKAILAKYIASNEVDAALEDLNALGFKTYPPTLALQRRALVWAERIKQTVAYDAQYLALAEQLRAELWTADKKFATSARAADATFVHLLEPAQDDKHSTNNKAGV